MPIIFILFFWSAGAGLVLFTLLYLPARRRFGHSKIWRVTLSSIVALAVTPTTMNFCGRDYIAPASYASLQILAPDIARRSIGLLHGILPVLAASVAISFIWSYAAKKETSRLKRE